MLTSEDKEKLFAEICNVLDKSDGIYIADSLENICLNSREIEDGGIDLPVGWNYNCGATKLVIYNSTLDYVFKIPLNGWLKEYEEYEEDYFENIDTEGWSTEKWDREIEGCKDIYYNAFAEDIFELYSGAQYTDEHWNYCENEAYIAEMAKEYGVSDFFALTEFLGLYHNYPIYIQPKCVIEECAYDDKETPYWEREETRKVLTDAGNGWIVGKIGLNWLTLAMAEYGEALLNKFIEFISIFEINDLHSGNRGFCNNMPVLVDYSGFCN